MRIITTFTLVCMVIATAAHGREKVNLPARGFDEVECPAAPGSSGPFLHTTAGGRVTLSWVEPAGDGHRLRFATWRDSAWGEPRTVAEGTGWFVNWADVPSVIADDDGRMAAHWLERSGDDTYAYDVRVSQSFDDGKTWSAPVTPHRDGTRTEHGFASLIFHNDYLHLVWLDGRKYADEALPDETTLRAARIDRNGAISGETQLDGRTCDCCPTAIAPVDGGFIVAYRDRSPDEIRDIYAVRYIDGKWEAPKPVANDGWEINGCPVNGPAIASRENRVTVVWFTMRGDEGMIRATTSINAGLNYEPSFDVERSSVGRVGIVCDPVSDHTWPIWIEGPPGNPALPQVPYVVTARMNPGAIGMTHNVVPTSMQRSSGYPRIAHNGKKFVVAWTDTRDPGKVRTVVGRVESPPSGPHR